MFSQMVYELKQYAGKSVVSALPNRAEWMKANAEAIQNGTYIPDTSKLRAFYTEERHYKKRA
jgi:hypothetical protein